MHRRDFLRHVAAASGAAGLGLGLPWRVPATPAEKPLAPGPGPQLFLDDYLIESLEGLSRQVQQPRKLDKPVLDSKTFGTTQPYLTVLRDAPAKRFHIWYNRGPAIAHA